MQAESTIIVSDAAAARRIAEEVLFAELENSSGSLVYPQLEIDPRLFDSDERGCVRRYRRREDEMDADRTAVTVRNFR